MSWIQLFSGRHFYFAQALEKRSPNDLFDIRDIAHALSNICRYGGHSRRNYTVAEHSILGTMLVPKKHKLAFLLHDATEAYIGDLVRPLKMMDEYKPYRDFEDELQVRIFERFGLDPEMSKEVKAADNLMLCLEAPILCRVAEPDWSYIFDHVRTFEGHSKVTKPDLARVAERIAQGWNPLHEFPAQGPVANVDGLVDTHTAFEEAFLTLFRQLQFDI